jgi:hypothetical protein
MVRLLIQQNYEQLFLITILICIFRIKQTKSACTSHRLDLQVQGYLESLSEQLIENLLIWQ